MSGLVKESDWAAIDGDICRVVRFTPLVKVVGGKLVEKRSSMPYALVTLQSRKLPPNIVGGIAHKVDFLNLWAACVERCASENEEVNITWTKSSLRWHAKLLSRFMPGLAVMICKAGAYELMTDSDHRPDLRGRERFEEERPILQLVPDVLR